jgi:hypothetical protein
MLPQVRDHSQGMLNPVQMHNHWCSVAGPAGNCLAATTQSSHGLTGQMELWYNKRRQAWLLRACLMMLH